MADRIPLVISGTDIREIPSSDRLDVKGALEVNGHITPGADSAYDIGTSSLKFRDIFLSAGTIHLGGVKLRADGNKLSIQDSTGATSSLAAASQFVSGDSGSSEFLLRVSDAISLVDAGGLGSMAYDSSLGKFTYTGPSQADVMSVMQAGNGIAIDSASGTLSIETTDSVTFGGLYASGNVIVGGNLTVTGTTTTVSSTNTTIADHLIELSSGLSGTNSNDLGILMERGSTGANAFMGFDESEDKFHVGTTTATADATGNLSITTGTLLANVEGSLTGTASLARRMDSAGRTFALTGDVTGSVTSDLAQGFSIAATIAANAVSSDELNSASTLTIKNTAGTTLKTVIGAGA
jgi:hypothetical protein